MGRGLPTRTAPRGRTLGLELLERRDLLNASAWIETPLTEIDLGGNGTHASGVAIHAPGFQASKTGPLAKVNSTLATMFGGLDAGNSGFPNGAVPVTLHGVQVDDGAVLVDAVAAADPSDLQRDLISLGMRGASRFGRVVSGWLPLDAIGQMAALDSLQFGSAALRPRTHAGSVTSQGDRAQWSNVARSTFDVDGSGVKVGVLSDSFNTAAGSSYAEDRQSGDLPPGVQVLADQPGGVDEGRAMLQLVHDVAPGARLAFHTAFGGLAGFASGIVALADAGADVIVDDILYFAEPMFQDGIVAQAVDSVVARGVSYFSSAGNAGRDSYESPFVDSGQVLTVDGAPSGKLHDFDPGPGIDVQQQIRVPVGGSFVLTLQWDEPFFSAGGAGSRSDLDIYLVADDTAVAWSASANVGGDAVEIISFYNSGFDPSWAAGEFQLMISLDAGPAPGLLKTVRYDAGPGTTVAEFDTASSTVYGHANAAGAMAVGAAFYQNTPRFGVSPPRLEPFSSSGGTPILFDANGNRRAATVRAKPDVVAPDGTNTTFFTVDIPQDGDARPNFFGTSAAAPHAAAVAALMLESNPSLPPQQISEILGNTAVDMEASGFDFDSGYGLIDARAALAAAVATAGHSDPPPVTDEPESTVIGESGSLRVRQASSSEWHDVTFSRSYADPIVVMGPLSYAGRHPSNVRVRNVTSHGFQFQIDEWDYLDGAHAPETVGYLVVEAGTHLLTDGTQIVAGETTAAASWRSVALPGRLTQPIVLAQVTGYVGPAAVTTRLRNVTASGFQVRVQEEEGNDRKHAVEPIAYVAWDAAAGSTSDLLYEANVTPDAVRHTISDLSFAQTFDAPPVLLANVQTFDGPDTVTIRYTSLTAAGASWLLEEERSGDSETNHTTEVVGYVALDEGPLRAVVATSLASPGAGTTAAGGSGSISLSQADALAGWSDWVAHAFSDRVLVTGSISHQKRPLTTIRALQVAPGEFQYQIGEWDDSNGGYTVETIGHLVVEAGRPAPAATATTLPGWPFDPRDDWLLCGGVGELDELLTGL